MKIVVLDGFTLNPGDLSWQGLEALGDCTVHDRTPPGQVRERAAAGDIVLTNKTVLDRSLIDDLADLRFIGVLATGYNVVDTQAARARGIPVCNVPTYGTQSVAQMVFAHVLNLTQHVAEHAESVKQGSWTGGKDFCYWNFPLVELAGKSMGIVGFGRIGRATAQVALGLGMKVLAYDTQPIAPAEGVRAVDLDTLFRESDVVSLHCPLTDENTGMVNAERIAGMKSSALLVNTSRGPLVDAAALADALNEGRLGGAGIDVMEVEPPPMDNPLMSARNCYITPHIAWATREARARLMDVAVDNVKAFLDGKPQNVVNETAS